MFYQNTNNNNISNDINNIYDMCSFIYIYVQNNRPNKHDDEDMRSDTYEDMYTPYYYFIDDNIGIVRKI